MERDRVNYRLSNRDKGMVNGRVRMRVRVRDYCSNFFSTRLYINTTCLY